VGGLVGYTYSGPISNSYWDTETSGQSSSSGGIGKTTTQMKQQATFVGWDFINIWNIIEDVTYPYHRWENEPPVADAGGPYVANEGTGITFDASGSSDPDGDELRYRWDFDSDSTWDTDWSTSPTASHTWYDDYTGIVTVEVSDGEETDTATADVTVNNVAPVVETLTVPIIPIKVNDPVYISGTFSDVGIEDSHTATIKWAEGIEKAGTVDGYSVTGSHSYTSAGVYTITLMVTDDDSGSGSMIALEYIVVYDPSGGFVTGGGWIDSPEGAYTADPTLTGKANFGFVSKYKKGADTPTGSTEFQFKAGDLNFHSNDQEWLVIVVAGARAQYKGTGTINGAGNFGFKLTAIDGELNGGGGTDKFRIKIWDKDDNDVIVYDNLIGADDDADPTTILGGGQIKIHKA
jgi:hypothetical protein